MTMKKLALMFGMFSLIACTQHNGPVVIATPKQKPSGDLMYMTALLRNARLAVDNGCLRIYPAGETGSYLAVFPYGYSVNANRDGYTILDASGRQWARTDGSRDIGGGEASSIDAALFSDDLSKCSGPYWFVSP